VRAAAIFIGSQNQVDIYSERGSLDGELCLKRRYWGMIDSSFVCPQENRAHDLLLLERETEFLEDDQNFFPDSLIYFLLKGNPEQSSADRNFMES
jgi:hypothetical protein